MIFRLQLSIIRNFSAYWMFNLQVNFPKHKLDYKGIAVIYVGIF